MKYPDLTAGDGEFLLNLIGGWEKFQQLKTGALTLVVKGSDLLKQVAIATVQSIGEFVAKDDFKVDTSAKAKVKIGCLGDNFTKHFLPKVERDVPATELAVYTLAKASLDIPILAELGDKAETTLAHLWQLLQKQGNGQAGTLLTNGYANIFYIRDSDGTLWAVCADWDASCGGWDVEAGSVDGPDGWSAGLRVVSRK